MRLFGSPSLMKLTAIVLPPELVRIHVVDLLQNSTSLPSVEIIGIANAYRSGSQLTGKGIH
jgi:hypothetical protein